jgi:hypothetical protein
MICRVVLCRTVGFHSLMSKRAFRRVPQTPEANAQQGATSDFAVFDTDSKKARFRLEEGIATPQVAYQRMGAGHARLNPHGQPPSEAALFVLLSTPRGCRCAALVAEPSPNSR